MRELTSLMRQNVVQNKADYDAIRQKLEAILSMAQKHRQEGSQRPLDRRVENLAMCVVMMLHELSLTCPSVLSNVTRIRLNVYRSDGSLDVRSTMRRTPLRSRIHFVIL